MLPGSAMLKVCFRPLTGSNTADGFARGFKVDARRFDAEGPGVGVGFEGPAVGVDVEGPAVGIEFEGPAVGSGDEDPVVDSESSST